MEEPGSSVVCVCPLGMVVPGFHSPHGPSAAQAQLNSLSHFLYSRCPELCPLGFDHLVCVWESEKIL